ncbi:MAG: ABC transporter ATP-binding protein/permease [Tissierellales bacterium]|jgi:ATP-binding cassette subfamily B protein|nr:ABC transporter ATP-binding protein/permease [Tissierellales bacterium]
MRKPTTLSRIRIFARPCKMKLILSIVCAIISVIGSIVPYFGVYEILKRFMKGNIEISEIWYFTGICVLGYVVKLLFYGISTTLSHISAYTILQGIRLKMMNKMMKAPLGTILNQTSGKLKNVIVDRVETIELPLAHMIPEGISNGLLPLGIFIYLMNINAKMAFISLITIPFGIISFMSMMKNFSKKYDDFMKASNHVNSVIVEYIGGIEVIKAFSQTQDSYEKFSDSVSSFKEFTLEWFRATWKSMNFTIAILPSTLLGTIPMGLYLYIDGELAPLEFAMCLILSLGLITPLMWFTVAINDSKTISYAIEDAASLLDIEELNDSEIEVELKNYDIKLENVSFSYEEQSSNVLENINLDFKEGTFSALVGPSGGGKSTIAKLITRFWDVKSGSIKINDIDIRHIPLSQLSKIISFVTQDNFLFDCSILENIRMGKPSASDEEVYRAARAAQCEEFVLRLELGYQTNAGEAGAKLSGGERQRIAIARALLKDAPIVILDEATAFTDPENEDKLQKSISALTRGKTLIVIAHRLSTIKSADQIVLMKEGEVDAAGTQDELLKNSKLYKELWKAHIGTKNWSDLGEMEERAYA